ncbi:pyridoxal phosphate-dependent transferase [Piptocephalis cylindrospora]|uniref:Pyridoxal phosphate-dependent transferase n=1 Tax=Piptocephalis cylindrospora TaxID=1907219 RepID=A0A4P9Y0K4_9FUNG|nr:pyridoxal phosphate-dependent transferase [Piptocephalis cylindrospora]|eukprot:RKP12194.1 pyridoxal phosphate-dependent transferase [Piptocephalis cylindrospora]
MYRARTLHRIASGRRVFDLRSDTVTKPTEAMIREMAKAEVGDDVYGEDPSVNALEDRVAQIMGKEKALFCASATMCNILSITSLLAIPPRSLPSTSFHGPPYSVACDYRSHLYLWEAGNLATFGHATTIPLRPRNGLYLNHEDIAQQVWRPGDVHVAPTRVISLENTLDGLIMPLKTMQRMYQQAREQGHWVHLDGARLWNSSVATGTPMAQYGHCADTITLCLSKGIGAPIGAILAPQKTIEQARHYRKLLGGGWRQAGGLAAAATRALLDYHERMSRDHHHAQLLGKGAVEAGWKLALPIHTNMVWMEGKHILQGRGWTSKALEDHFLKQWGIRVNGVDAQGQMRCVLHHQVRLEDVQVMIRALADLSK